MEEKTSFEIEDTYGENHENQDTYGDFVLKKNVIFREKSIFFKISFLNGDYVTFGKISAKIGLSIGK